MSDEIVIRLSQTELDALTLALGYAAGAAVKDNNQDLYQSFLRVANAVHRDNPRWIPYEIAVLAATEP